MQYAAFGIMRDIRRKAPDQIAKILRDRLESPDEITFASNDRLYLHQQNRKHIQRMLARLTDYVETQSGQASRYLEYINTSRQGLYEIEHIWADKPERHTDEFSHPNDFRDYRNRIGDLLLLPKSFNASYGDLPYSDKLPHYNTHNLLARSLHPQCYDHNPGFLRFMEESALPFKPHSEFKKADLDARTDLYRRLAERIWDPAHLTAAISAQQGV